MPSGATDGERGKVIDAPQCRRDDYQLSAQRRIVLVIGKLACKKSRRTIPGRRLCIYTTSKPPAELRAEMERMNLLSADSYEELKDTDPSGPALPQWWDSVRFAAWNLIPIGERS